MKNIDKIFNKLKDNEVEAPDIWNKLESQLSNAPKTNLNNNLDKVGATKLTTNVVFKAIGLVAGCGIIGVGAYLFINSFNDSKENVIVKTKIETSKINDDSVKNDDGKIISIEKAKQITSPIATLNQNNQDTIIAFKVSDEKTIVLENRNYSVKTINSSQSYPTEININHIKEDSLVIVKKVLPSNLDIPDFKPSNVITPNGDGINDVFVIKDVDKFPDNCLIVFDRNGKSVYKCKGYKNNFKAINIPIGTYFYKFEFKNLDKKEIKGGSITVM
ncbi:MAG: gliding motility-associated C-terminal domain-containing protein [Bacteroidales bacterium]|nr:gliding motility-associated C-terminal domain-containing protein [Bacteroidales bacterium]